MNRYKVIFADGHSYIITATCTSDAGYKAKNRYTGTIASIIYLGGY